MDIIRKKISDEYIRLDSFLKLVNCVRSGGEAKTVIQNGLVFVDEEICTLRGKKLYNGAKVKYNGKIFEVISGEGNLSGAE